MANKRVFKSAPKGKTPPQANTTNRAGGLAYKLSDKAALAQYAATGTISDGFYSTAELQLTEVLEICNKITDLDFIAKVAVYARTAGRMKDMPALLCAYISTKGEAGTQLLKQIFPVVIDNGRMLRNFVQVIRSGVTGRKSLGTAPKNLVRKWFHSRTPETIFRMSVGNDPTLGDVMNLCHLDDLKSPERAALFLYMTDTKEHDKYNPTFLPKVVQEYEELKKDPKNATTLPKVPFEMLMGLDLSDKGWRLLAQQMSWTQLRMNLNTLSRHGVFGDVTVAKMVAEKLRNKELIEKAKPFPYQLLMTYLNTQEDGPEAVPRVVRDALHDAVDHAVNNLPFIEGPSHALIDVSGSMGSPITGYRGTATSKARCVDVAALIGSMFLRKNKESSIIAFSDGAITKHGCEARDSVMTNAKRLASIGGGGTNLSAAFQELNRAKAKGDLVVVASDMQTWADGADPYARYGLGYSCTVPASYWAEYKSRNPKAKLVCINLQADSTCQVTSNKDVLNIGGFSDSMFDVIKKFVEGVPEKSADYWVETIENIQLPLIGAKNADITPESSLGTDLSGS